MTGVLWPTESRPTRQHERWKYTDLTALFQSHWCEPSAESSDRPSVLHVDWGVVIPFHNGKLLKGWDTRQLPPGVTLRQVDEEEFGVDHGALLSPEDCYFLSPHQQVQRNTFILSVEAARLIETPLYFHYLTDDKADQAWLPVRCIFQLAEGAGLTVLSHFEGAYAGVYGVSGVSEWHLEKTASLTHYLLQQESKAAYHFHTQIIRQAADSLWQQHHLSLGAALARTDSFVYLQGENAATHFYGFYHADRARQTNHYLQIHHKAACCESQQYYKGIVDERAHGVFNSKVVVHKGALHSISSQANHNLLLSSLAEIDTKPDLEIYTDEVQCSHGATVGSLDEDALFYLCSRGLSKDKANALLTAAFALEVTQKIPEASMRGWMQEALVNALHLTE